MLQIGELEAIVIRGLQKANYLKFEQEKLLPKFVHCEHLMGGITVQKESLGK